MKARFSLALFTWWQSPKNCDGGGQKPARSIEAKSHPVSNVIQKWTVPEQFLADSRMVFREKVAKSRNEPTISFKISEACKTYTREMTLKWELLYGQSAQPKL